MRNWIVLSVVVVASGGAAFAKRGAPADVLPVVHEGKRYEAPHFDGPCGQKGGCVVAVDSVTNAQLWKQKVYCTKYDRDLEMDVQDVFITSLQIDGGRLRVEDEKSRKFFVDLRTREVTGDQRGCDGGGCSYAAGSAPGRAEAWVLLTVATFALALARSAAKPRSHS